MKLIKAKSKNRFTGGEPFITLPRNAKVNDGEGEDRGETDLTLPEADYYIDTDTITFGSVGPQITHTLYSNGNVRFNSNDWDEGSEHNTTLENSGLYPYLFDQKGETKVCFIGRFEDSNNVYKYYTCYPKYYKHSSSGYVGWLLTIDEEKEHTLSGVLQSNTDTIR